MAEYLAIHGKSHKPTTLERWKVSIGKAHTSAKLEDPTKSELVRVALRGIRRKCGTAKRQVSPITKEDLLAMAATTNDSIKGLRDRALLLVGFASAMRRSELVAINREDVKVVKDGLIITIRRSKTDQEGAGRKVAIPHARGEHCPVKAYQELVKASKVNSGAVFMSVDRHGHVGGRLPSTSVARLLKEYAGKVGLDPKQISGHSLRAGLATSAAAEGVTVFKIMNQTGHKSSRMLDTYVRDGQAFTDNAAGIL